MSASATSKLQGIFTPLLVPLDDRGQINESELRRFVSWLIERGVHGLYPNGSTAEDTAAAMQVKVLTHVIASPSQGVLSLLPK